MTSSSAACLPADPWEDAACPPTGTTLDYASFGQGFMTRHCVRCHTEGLEERDGAPLGYDFDSQEGVQRWAREIYERSAGDNVSMPPGPDDPPEEEREALAEWLACGAP